jgi:carbon starvation protein
MAVMTIWAVILNEVKFSAGHNALLTVINLLVLIIAVWILIEGVIKFFTTEEEPTAPAAPETA